MSDITNVALFNQLNSLIRGTLRQFFTVVAGNITKDISEVNDNLNLFRTQLNNRIKGIDTKLDKLDEIQLIRSEIGGMFSTIETKLFELDEKLAELISSIGK